MTVALALTACGSPRRGEPVVGPMPLENQALVHGRMLFDQHCYKCHGEGEGALGPALNDKPLPKFLMRFQVRVGLGTMPAFSEEQISDAELEDLLDYLVALRRHGRDT